jgi:hypothetical protein
MDLPQRVPEGVQSVEDLAAQAKDFIYLASPYSLGGTADDAAMDRRHRQITRCCHALMRLGANVYSPITHHHSTQSVGGTIEGDSNYWLTIDFGVLKHAKGMYVLTLDGWEKSVCVSREIEYARDTLNIPVIFIRPDKYILGDGYE